MRTLITIYAATVTALVILFWLFSRPPVVYEPPIFSDEAPPIGCPGDRIPYAQYGFVRYNGAIILDMDVKRMPVDGGDHVTGTSQTFRLPVYRGPINDTDTQLVIPSVPPGEYRLVQAFSLVGGWMQPTMREIEFEVREDCPEAGG